MGLRVQILLGLALVTLFAILSTGYLALWAAGASLRMQRESSALVMAGTAAKAAGAVVDGSRPLTDPENRARGVGVSDDVDCSIGRGGEHVHERMPGVAEVFRRLNCIGAV